MFTSIIELRSKIDSKILNKGCVNMDTFFKDEALLEKLKVHYKKHGKIIVAYDYDDTIAPTYMSKSCDQVIQLLKDLKPYGVFICYTSNENLDNVRDYIAKHNIPCDKINENVDFVKERYDKTGKIYYNVFLDDKTGLGQTYRILRKFLKYLQETEKLA